MFRYWILLMLALVAAPFAFSQDKTPLTLIVMDPLAAPLSCPCVKGYAQRDYEKLAKQLETHNSCSDGATKILDMHKSGEKAVTVISSYAQPLLEGCGTIKKGDLRVLGETDPMPFVVAFISERVNASDRAAIQAALFS